MVQTLAISDLVLSQHDAIITFLALAGFLAVNMLSFVQFFLDKHRAITGGRRVPESTLLLFSALGPFGAYAGMKAFRHKTRKLRFRLVPLFAAAYLFLAALLLF